MRAALLSVIAVLSGCDLLLMNGSAPRDPTESVLEDLVSFDATLDPQKGMAILGLPGLILQQAQSAQPQSLRPAARGLSPESAADCAAVVSNARIVYDRCRWSADAPDGTAVDGVVSGIIDVDRPHHRYELSLTWTLTATAPDGSATSIRLSFDGGVTIGSEHLSMDITARVPGGPSTGSGDEIRMQAELGYDASPFCITDGWVKVTADASGAGLTSSASAYRLTWSGCGQVSGAEVAP